MNRDYKHSYWSYYHVLSSNRVNLFPSLFLSFMYVNVSPTHTCHLLSDFTLKYNLTMVYDGDPAVELSLHQDGDELSCLTFTPDLDLDEN